MSILLYHHPHTRSAHVVYYLEEVGVEYSLRPVEVRGGEHKTPELLALNPMGKLPILVDGETVVTESAAIALYLGDRYRLGDLAPAFDDPARGTYLRWSLFAPSVIEPAAMAKAGAWDVNVGAAGWGTHEAMMQTLREALSGGPWLLGERFSLADGIVGGTLRFMMRFGMLPSEPVFTSYVRRLEERPAMQRADQKNAAIAQELGL